MVVGERERERERERTPKADRVYAERVVTGTFDHGAAFPSCFHDGLLTIR